MRSVLNQFAATFLVIFLLILAPANSSPKNVTVFNPSGLTEEQLDANLLLKFDSKEDLKDGKKWYKDYKYFLYIRRSEQKLSFKK